MVRARLLSIDDGNGIPNIIDGPRLTLRVQAFGMPPQCRAVEPAIWLDE